MLDSKLGIRLLLLLGKSIPLPAPYDITRAVTRVEVTNDDKTGDGFQITFGLTKTILGEYDLFLRDALAPGTRVVIAVVLGIAPEVLIDGIITHHQVVAGGPGQSTLTVTGKDVSVMLDLEERDAQYKNQPDSLIVMKVLLRYGQYGLMPEVMPTTDIPIELDRIPRQAQETDLQFLKRMATRNGYVFYIEPVTFLVNKAYWGPRTRTGVRQPRLTAGEGPSTNLTSLRFELDALAPVRSIGSFIEPITGTVLPIPIIPLPRIPPLAARPVPAMRTTLKSDTANDNPLQALLAAFSEVANAPDAVTGTGDIDTIAYGNILRARRLVGIRGAGISYDGYYYVHRVTHTITIGNYQQSFQVSREGTGALLPVVVP